MLAGGWIKPIYSNNVENQSPAPPCRVLNAPQTFFPSRLLLPPHVKASARTTLETPCAMTSTTMKIATTMAATVAFVRQLPNR